MGDLRLKHSDNRQPLGYVPIPVCVINGGHGPTVLLTGGVHGDEFEGPAALLELSRALTSQEVHGRIIILPALNAPALRAGSRVSPLDGGNLNRSFPGDPDGGPTAMIAHLVEEVLLPECDGALDLHSGGNAACFAPCTLAGRDRHGAVSRTNLALADAFGAPLVWVMGPLNDNRSLNAAATRKGIDMIAAELGGGGRVSPAALAIAHKGVRGFLKQMQVLEGPLEHTSNRRVEFRSADQYLHAPRAGLFVPEFEAGDSVKAGQSAGAIYSVTEVERAPARLVFPVSGVILSQSHRGLVERGELLAAVAVPWEG